MTPTNEGGIKLSSILADIPGGLVGIISILAIIITGVLFVKYNIAVLGWIGKMGQKLSKKISGGVGTHVKTVNKKFKRAAELDIKSFTFWVYRYFDEILVNTGLHRSGVSVAGLIFFILVCSVISTLVAMFAFNLNILAIPALIVFVFLYITLFRYISLTRVEKNEEVIMDAIDLLVSDVKGGIFNGIIKYKDSFHESVRPFFIECIDNVQNKGYSFEAAMEILTDQLGYSFSDFAAKAVYYEANRQEGTEGIFGAIIELNRQRRILRRENAEQFNSIKMSLLISFIAIGCFAVYTTLTEPSIRAILIDSVLGRLMLIADVFLIALVFSRLTAIRAKMI